MKHRSFLATTLQMAGKLERIRWLIGRLRVKIGSLELIIIQQQIVKIQTIKKDMIAISNNYKTVNETTVIPQTSFRDRRPIIGMYADDFMNLLIKNGNVILKKKRNK